MITGRMAFAIAVGFILVVLATIAITSCCPKAYILTYDPKSIVGECQFCVPDPRIDAGPQR